MNGFQALENDSVQVVRDWKTLQESRVPRQELITYPAVDKVSFFFVQKVVGAFCGVKRALHRRSWQLTDVDMARF